MRQRLLAKSSLVFISLIITTAAAFSSESPFLKRSGRNLVDNKNEKNGQKKYNKGFSSSSSSSSSLHVANGHRGGSDNNKNEKDLSEKQESSSSSSSSILFSPVVQFIGLLFRGVTLPFPTLRRLVEKQPSEEAKEDGGFSIQESVLAILVYLGLGAVAYHSSIQEWSFVDALYFSVVTFTTVGYGDLAPTTAVGKIFTILFGLSGITVLGIAIGTIGSRLLQKENEFLKVAEEASRKRIMGLVNSLVTEQQQQKTNNGTTLDTTTTAATNQEEVKPSSVWMKSFEMLINKSIPAVLILLFGGIYMGRLEGWSLSDSIYYSFITAATLGYGDFSPISRPGRVWAIIFIPLAVAAAGEVLGNIASFLSDRRRQRFYQSLMDRELNAETLVEMDNDRNGKVSREEYVEFMLKEMQLVDDEVFQDLHEQFKKLDIDGGGYLDKNDLKLKLQQQKADKANIKNNVNG